jgi:hypothetical protein
MIASLLRQLQGGSKPVVDGAPGSRQLNIDKLSLNSQVYLDSEGQSYGSSTLVGKEPVRDSGYSYTLQVEV